MLCGCCELWSQDKVVNSNAYEIFDQLVGQTNSGIFDGIEYFEKFQIRNDKHKFFKSADFKEGSLIFNDKPFLNLELKYDVYDDALLVRNSEVLGSPITQLDKEKVASFNITNNIFYNLKTQTNKGEDLDGFFELLSKYENIKLYKKHRKKINKKTDQGVYYEFKDDPWYLLYTNGSYFKLKNENTFITVFPELKDALKPIIRSKEKKEDFDSFLLSILQKVIEQKK